jgi:hypothetical protein
MNEIDEEVEDIVAEPPKPLSPAAVQRQKERCEVVRIFVELNHAINCLKITREIQSTCDELHIGFIGFTYRALVNDALSCLIRILDIDSKSFSFWTINNRFRQTVQMVCNKQNIDPSRIGKLRDRLRKARNKLHFHIDKEYAANPDDLWLELAITHEEMFEIATDLANVVGSILLEQYSFPANLSRYEAADVRPILECLNERGLGNFTKR